MGHTNPLITGGIVQSLSDGDGITLITVGDRLHVLNADPAIRISRVLIDTMREHPDPRYSFDGDLLKLYAVDRTVVYRLIRVNDDFYLGEWPD